MTKNSGFWIRLCLIGSAFLLFARMAQAQSAELSFDALPRARRADTTASPATPATPGVPRREIAAGMRRQIIAQRDSIARLHRALAESALIGARVSVGTRVGMTIGVRVGGS